VLVIMGNNHRVNRLWASFFVLLLSIVLSAQVQASNQQNITAITPIIEDLNDLRQQTKQVLHYGFLQHYVVPHIRVAKKQVKRGYRHQVRGRIQYASVHYYYANTQLRIYKRKIYRLARFGWITHATKNELLANADAIKAAIHALLNDPNQAPIANAGVDISAIVGETVQLDASGSTDINGDALTYAWSIISSPTNSSTSLSDATALMPTLVPDVAGSYTVQLIVNDGLVNSQADTVFVNVGGMNTAPVAAAGSDQQVTVNDTVILDGSASSDIDGDPLSFVWQFESKPNGSNATLQNADQTSPSFVPDFVGQYDLSLIVNDGTEDSAPDTVTVVADQGNVQPVANAGNDQSTLVNSTVILDASGSTDADGDALSYTWSVLNKPNGSAVVITNPDQVMQTLTIDVFGEYVFQLIVNDGQQNSDPDTIVVTTQNSPPLANAGADQSVVLGSTVQLDGNASSDVDGDSLNYSWSLIAKPTASQSTLTDPLSVMPSFIVDVPGEYISQLIVGDGTVDSAPDTVSVSTLNTRPVANAGDAQTVLTDDLVQLDGSGSNDAEGDTLTYEWSILSEPDFSQATLSSTTSVTPEFTADEVGLYVIQLAVNDGQLQSELSTVTIRVESAQALTIDIDEPTDGITTMAVEIDIEGTISRRGVVTLNTDTVTVDNLAFTQTVSLDEGNNDFTFTVTDALGDTAEASIRIIRDTIAPTVNINLVSISQPNGNGYVKVDGQDNSAEAGSTIRVTNDRTGESVVVTADANGAFTVLIAGGLGDTFTITATDTAGNQSGDLQAEIGQDNLIPPNPVDIAPELSSGNITPMDERVAFLYQGNNAVQTGVDVDQLDAKRTAVISGKITQDSGEPLSGVLVTIKDHPELGQTVSRLDGEYDLVVNGGGYLVVNYQLDGYLPVQRQVKTEWIGHAVEDDITMIPYDSEVTEINLTDLSQPFHVAQSSVSNDLEGQRRATVFFPSGTQATMTLPDGSQQTLSTINFRATEYTVGENGPQRMPATLPPASAYTYAVDLNIDEAIDAGATRVDFSEQLPSYVDNFLDFSVGTAVPIGWYDFERAAWVPSNDGIVIKILRIENGKAIIDVTDDDIDNNATAEQLANLDVTDEEMERLATLYGAGKTLWRSMIDHFTPWDWNWPYQPPEDATYPPQEGPQNGQEIPDVETPCDGCIIKAQSQTLAEEVPVTGTAFKLRYQSDRMVSRKSTFTIAVTEDIVPESVTAIEVVVKIAGQEIKRVFEPEPNLLWDDFSWDGYDRYGNEVYGLQLASIKISYAYRPVYSSISAFRSINGDRQRFSFGRTGGAGLMATVRNGRAIFRLSRHWTLQVASPHFLQSNSLGNLTVTNNHTYEFRSNRILKGDGDSVSAHSLHEEISVFGGRDFSGDSGDGGSVQNALMNTIADIAFDDKGNQYIADAVNHRIRKIDTSGIITTIAGNGSEGFSGDGGLAIQAQLAFPSAVAVKEDGSVYFSDTQNHRIRKIDKNGIISTIVGGGDPLSIDNGDEGLAIDAVLNEPAGILISPTGGFYIADKFHNKVRYVDVQGIISTVAGTGLGVGNLGDNGLAVEASLHTPTDVAMMLDGTLLIADNMNGRIRSVNPSGIINTFAGGGVIDDYKQPVDKFDAHLEDVISISVDSKNNVYVATSEYGYTILKISENEYITQFAGAGFDYPASLEPEFPGTFATALYLTRIASVGVAPNDEVYIGDNSRIYRVQSALPDNDQQDDKIVFGSRDGQLLYEFDQYGKHLTTTSATTGDVIYTFAYNDDDQLVRVTDIDGDITQINRNASGSSIDIIAQDGQVTHLEVDNRNFVGTVTNPLGHKYLFKYKDNGLLEEFTDRASNTWQYRYNRFGGLIEDIAPNGGGWKLDRTELDGGSEVEMTSGENRVTTFKSQRVDFFRNIQETTFPDKTKSTRTEYRDGCYQVEAPNGVITHSCKLPDPRFGIKSGYVAEMDGETPNGIKFFEYTNRSVSNFSPLTPDVFDVFSTQRNVNGRVYYTEYNQPTRTLLSRSPEQREQIDKLDDKGRVIHSQLSGFAATNIDYDSRGRVDEIREGQGADERKLKYEYDSHGYLWRVTDPLGRSLQFENDALGRTKNTTSIDGRMTHFDWDDNGNLKSIQPPGKDLHVFNYNSVDQQDVYTPPNLSGVSTITEYFYNLDQQLTQVKRPDNQVVDFIYDGVSGKLGLTITPQHTTDYTYMTNTGQIDTITHSGGVNLDYTWDGPLQTGVDWSGLVSGQLVREYDHNFWLTGLSLNGQKIIYKYDNDGFVELAGNLTLLRNAETGLVDRTEIGVLNQVNEYKPNLFGELESVSYQRETNGASLQIDRIEAVSDSGGVYYRSDQQIYFSDSATGNAELLSELFGATALTTDDNGTLYFYKDGAIQRLENGVVSVFVNTDGTVIGDMVFAYGNQLIAASGDKIYKVNNGALELFGQFDYGIFETNVRLESSTWGAVFVDTSFGGEAPFQYYRLNEDGTFTLMYDDAAFLTAGAFDVDSQGRICTAVFAVSKSQCLPPNSNQASLPAFNATTIDYVASDGTFYGYALDGNDALYGHTQLFGSADDSIYRLISGNPNQETIAVHATGSDELLRFGYTYDKLGRIETKTEVIQGNTSQTVYVYDNANRLESVTIDGNSETFTYDANGNRAEGVYDEQDRLESWGSTTYGYNLNGDLESKTESGITTQYQYDALGSLLQVTLPGDITIDYMIDGLGRRVGKKVNNVMTQGFLYQDQLNPIAELGGNGDVVSRFVYANRSNIPAYMIKGGQNYRIISNHLGSPRMVVNAQTGEVVQEITYDVWGKVLSDTNPGFQPFGFAGGLIDLHTELVRFGARDYDPETGRWTNKDPIGFAGGDTNLYGYVLNDPVNFIDPTGEVWQYVCGAAAILAAKQLLRNLFKNTPKKGGYKPNEGLPKDKHGHKVPSSDNPHTQIGSKKSRRTGESYRQTREWGGKGDRGYDGRTPKKDTDWTDHNRPSNHTNPHDHKYNPDTGKRQ